MENVTLLEKIIIFFIYCVIHNTFFDFFCKTSIFFFEKLK